MTFDILDFYVNLRNKDIYLHGKKIFKFEAVDLIRRGLCTPDDIYRETIGFKVFVRVNTKSKIG